MCVFEGCYLRSESSRVIKTRWATTKWRKRWRITTTNWIKCCIVWFARASWLMLVTDRNLGVRLEKRYFSDIIFDFYWWFLLARRVVEGSTWRLVRILVIVLGLWRRVRITFLCLGVFVSVEYFTTWSILNRRRSGFGSWGLLWRLRRVYRLRRSRHCCVITTLAIWIWRRVCRSW